MKKSTVKLVVRRETLRVLAELELVRVAGGNDAQLLGTEGPATGCQIVQGAQAIAKPEVSQGDTGDPVGSCVNAKG